MSTMRRASLTSLSPQALKNAVPPPNVAAPSDSAETRSPDLPRNRYSMLTAIGALFECARVEEVVGARRLEAGAAQREGDLRPVPDLVQQDVEEELARRQHEIAAAQHGEGARLVGEIVVQFGGELF